MTFSDEEVRKALDEAVEEGWLKKVKTATGEDAWVQTGPPCRKCGNPVLPGEAHKWNGDHCRIYGGRDAPQPTFTDEVNEVKP